jgi:16S rRNA (cytosine967-C5)-methyltransferase
MSAIKLFPNLTEGVVEALNAIFEKGYQADRVIEFSFKKNKKWGARDRAFVAETTYEIVRWWRLLWFYLNEKEDYTRDKLYRLLGAYLLTKGRNIPEWEEFSRLNKRTIYDRQKLKPESIAVQLSISDWLAQKGLEELKTDFIAEIKEMNIPALPVLRLNTLVASPEMFEEFVANNNVEFAKSQWAENAYILHEKHNVFRWEIFKKGWFEVQDLGSQTIAEFLDVKPGMKVIDACAGAGGKTLHLAALMQNKGKIVALDTEEARLHQLKIRARRAQAFTIETKVIENSKTIKRLEGYADAMLLDVPCTGTGVLKRNVDAKLKIDKSLYDKVNAAQTEILNNYPKMLKKGGVMVYATCSILPSENQNKVAAFLDKNPEFELLEERKLLPSHYHFDGFYMAKMKRKI